MHKQLTKGFLSRPELNVAAIGSARFWAGAVAGTLFAISLNMLFVHFFEAFRFLAIVFSFPSFLSPTETLLWRLFYAAFAISLSLSITFFVWFGNRRKGKNSFKLSLSKTLSQFTLWGFLYAFNFFATSTMFISYMQRGYDGEMLIGKNFWMLFLLLPIVVFLSNWHSVRLAYKIRKFFWGSIAASTLLIASFTFLPRNLSHISNNYFYSLYEMEITKINSEFSRADSLFGMEFHDSLRNVLLNIDSERAIHLTEKIVNAFESNENLTLDTIILARILTHNFHFSQYAFDENYKLSPYLVFNHIQKFSPDDVEFTELLLLVREKQKIAFPGYFYDYENTNRNYYYKLLNFTRRWKFNDFREAMLAVTKALMETEEYSTYHYLIFLPEELPEMRRRHLPDGIEEYEEEIFRLN